MKIEMFNPCFAYMRGGGETATKNLATALKSLGYDITILCYRSFFKRPSPITTNIPIEYVPSLYELRELSRILPGKFGGGAYWVQVEFYKLALRLHIDKWDIIHDQGIEAMEVAVKKNKKVIVTLQGMPNFKLRDFLARCKYIVVPAYSIIRILKDEWKLKNVLYIPHTIDLNKFTKRNKNQGRQKTGIYGNPVILFVGRLIQEKNIETLLKAFDIVLKTYPEARLYIVGGGIIEKRLKKLSCILGINKNVEFAGVVSHENLPYYYNSCDVYVQPSVIDFIPYSTLEAIASGCKLVVSNKVVDTIERFPQVRVARADSSEDFAEKIIDVLLGKYTPIPQEDLEEFSINSVAKKYASLYEEIV